MASENRKKLDNRIRVQIENCIQTNHRSFFVLVGEKAKSQVGFFGSIVKVKPS